MTSRLLWALRLAPAFVLSGLLSLLPAPAAQAQSMLGSDPYRPYYGGYENSSLPPSAMNNFVAAEAARSRSYSARANEMTQYYDELYGTGNGAPNPADGGRRVPLPGVSYTAGDRVYDRDFGRVYTPNTTQDGRNIDAEFYKDQQKRARDYAAALQEKDPKKRSEMLRAVELENQRAARAASPNPRSQPARNGRALAGTTAPAPGALRTPGSVARVPAGPAGAPTSASARARAGRSYGTTAPSLSPPSSSRFGDTAPPPPSSVTLPPETPRSTAPGAARPSASRPFTPILPLTNPRSSLTRPARPRPETPAEILDRALRTPEQPEPGAEETGPDASLPSRAGRPAGTGTSPFRTATPR